MYIYIHIHMVYIYIYIYSFLIYIYAYIHMNHIYIYAHTYVYVYIYIHLYMHTYLHNDYMCILYLLDILITWTNNCFYLDPWMLFVLVVRKHPPPELQEFRKVTTIFRSEPPQTPAYMSLVRLSKYLLRCYPVVPSNQTWWWKMHHW